jgi:hypothetical protein
MEKKLSTALIAYAVLLLLAIVLLDGTFRKAVAILLVGLAARTVIAWKAGWIRRERDIAGSNTDSERGVP